MRILLLAFCVLGLCFVSSPLAAQQEAELPWLEGRAFKDFDATERSLEVDRRWKRTLRAWQHCSDEIARKNAAVELRYASRHVFYGMRHHWVALDEAWRLLLEGTDGAALPPDWVAKVAFRVNGQFLDPDKEWLSWSLEPFYGLENLPTGSVKLRLENLAGDMVHEFESTAEAQSGRHSLKSVSDGDYEVSCDWISGDECWELSRIRISILRQQVAIEQELMTKAKGFPEEFRWLRNSAQKVARDNEALGNGKVALLSQEPAAWVHRTRALLNWVESGKEWPPSMNHNPIWLSGRFLTSGIKTWHPTPPTPLRAA